jgi:hypothetical protein
MSRVVTALMLVAAIIHLLPLPGVMGGAMLERLYGVKVDDPSLALLLRHRALLFGLVAGLLLAAIVWPYLKPAALTVALISTVSFLILAGLAPQINAAVLRVVVVDVVAIVCLVAACVIDRLFRSR